MARVNIRWENNHNIDQYTLFFTPYYDEEQIAVLRKSDDAYWIVKSELLQKNNDYICSWSTGLDKAKKLVETMVEEHYQDEINYYTELLYHFKEGSDGSEED